MMQFRGNTGGQARGHRQWAALTEQQMVNEKGQQLCIVGIISGILALVPIDEGLAYSVIGVLLSER